MPNPLDFFDRDRIKHELGLTDDDLNQSYQPSSGGVWHMRGAEGEGKTLMIAHKVRELIDKKVYAPEDITANITFKGKYGYGARVLKGEDLKQYLWDAVHKEYKHKIIIIDEADTEFPARFFSTHEQTEIALGLWHTQKLGNSVFMSSHLGNGADLILYLASHYLILPKAPNWSNQSLVYAMIDCLRLRTTYWIARDIVKTMLIYNRQESTFGHTEYDKERTKKRAGESKNHKRAIEDDIDIMAELGI